MSDTSTAAVLETEPDIEPETGTEPETEPETEPQTEPETDSDDPEQDDPEQDDPEQDDPDPVLEAVNGCRNAYLDAYHLRQTQLGGPGKASKYLCQEHACEAYRNALPVLSSRQNILAFMACVAEGVLTEAIPDKTGSKLIYAAQAALGALPRHPKPGRNAT
jgi:hypothetical protein